MKFRTIDNPVSKLGKSGFNQILVESFEFELDNIEMSIPKGFESDRASVPRIFWNLIPPLGKYSIAALIHDYFYRTHRIKGWMLAVGKKEWVDAPITKDFADTAFLSIMKHYNVKAWRRNVMYWAVKYFGSKSWEAHSK